MPEPEQNRELPSLHELMQQLMRNGLNRQALRINPSEIKLNLPLLRIETPVPIDKSLMLRRSTRETVQQYVSQRAFPSVVKKADMSGQRFDIPAPADKTALLRQGAIESVGQYAGQRRMGSVWKTTRSKGVPPWKQKRYNP